MTAPHLPLKVFQSAKVLIVDDDETSLRPLERILEKLSGLHPITTTDPREVLFLYREHHPDIILLDLGMPFLDGFQVLDLLRAEIPADGYLPVIVLTADDSAETRLRALAAGAKDFLNKPFDANEVWLRICNLLETRFLHLELQSQNMLLEERVLERTAQLEATLAQLHATQARIIRQERFGALGVMASGIAHDFNNSLTAILGFGELLLDRPGQIEYLRPILTAAQDARQTVYRLREFYRGENSADTQVAVQLNKIVEHAVLLTRPRWSNQALASGIKISVETALGELPLLRGNPAELRELLMNLIFNAVDAMPHGGTISVRTRAQPDTITLEVTDTGSGMDAQTAARCMEPFFTTKGERGTGLGLAVVYGAVQRHRGGIEVQSAPGEGTTFTVRFPVFAGGHLPSLETPVPALEQPLRILMVDDQPVICELLARLLSTDGHVVDAVGGGGAALAQCRAHHYDVVITDQAMPGMSGEQLADVIKQLMPDMPVILLTGFDDLPEGSVHNFAGVDLMLNKPVTLTDLRRGILKVMTMRSRPAAAA